MGKRSRSDTRSLPAGLSILYEDRDILVVDKPSGLLTMGTERDRSRTAYSFLTNYVRKGNPRSRDRVFIVHRLDRETSGVLVFARSELAKHRLQGQWDQVNKRYLAVVHGRCEKSADTITTYLTENTAHVVYSTTDRTKGKLSHTAYRVLKQAKDFALLEVDLLTGRKNQIRVHLAGIGHSIVGDRKYGIEKQACNRLALHAQTISLPHPTTGQQLCFTSPMPGFFHKLVGAFKLDDDLGTGQP